MISYESKINLILYTDIQRFEDWLDRYQSETLPFNVDIGPAKILIVLNAPTYRDTHRGLRRHQIKAFTNEPDPANPKTIIATPEIRVIELELFESANMRLNVLLNCKHNGLFNYYLDMLKAIAKLWPEAEELVQNYIQQHNPQLDDTEKNENDVKPIYYEINIEPARIKDVLRFIIELNDQRGGISSAINQPEGVIRWIEFTRKEGEDNQLSFVASEKSEKKGQKLVREFLGEVIKFKCMSIGNKVKIMATCWDSENPLVEEYFQYLWKKLMEFLPIQKGESMEDISRDLALKTTGIIVGAEYDELSMQEVKDKAARFDAMRYGGKRELQVGDKSKNKVLETDTLSTKPPARREILDQASLRWAAQGNLGYFGRYSRKEFLQDFEDTTGEYISPDEHKRALRDAESRGLIQKIKGRFRPLD